jgi:hypothetical protein
MKQYPNDIYIINVARNRYKEHIQPGSMTLKLKMRLEKRFPNY